MLYYFYWQVFELRFAGIFKSGIIKFLETATIAVLSFPRVRRVEICTNPGPGNNE